MSKRSELLSRGMHHPENAATSLVPMLAWNNIVTDYRQQILSRVLYRNTTLGQEQGELFPEADGGTAIEREEESLRARQQHQTSVNASHKEDEENLRKKEAAKKVFEHYMKRRAEKGNQRIDTQRKKRELRRRGLLP